MGWFKSMTNPAAIPPSRFGLTAAHQGGGAVNMFIASTYTLTAGEKRQINVKTLLQRSIRQTAPGTDTIRALHDVGAHVRGFSLGDPSSQRSSIP
jgi:hypothetical protein